MTDAAQRPPALSTRARLRLWAEALILFVGVPVAMAAWFGAYSLFGALWALTALGLALLAVTPGFRWRLLLRPPGRGDWAVIAGFTVLTAAVCAAVALWMVPASFLSLPRHRTELWLMILLLYPPLSALPQEILYRTLFFERYGVLIRHRGALIALNGAAFGLGHLFFMNPVTIAMTAVGGAAMGWAYLRHRSLTTALLLHAAAGLLAFTMGLGRFFYHGAAG